MKKTQIAILGSTSHVAKGLIYNFLQSGDSILHLYSRTADKVRSFLDLTSEFSQSDSIIHEGYGDFIDHTYDVVINCVGVGTTTKLQGNYPAYFTVTEEYDNLAIGYLRNIHPKALYISFSSGAIYGGDFSAPADESTLNNIRVNHVTKSDYYGIVRLYCEAKHRAFTGLRIVDLRIFSYFSRFIDLTDGYFITEVLDCILKGRTLATSSVNIVRDYLHPKDLFSIVRKCIEADNINSAFDTISTRPVEKREILNYFSSEYGLKYEIIGSMDNISATGLKNIYYSTYNNAAEIAHVPMFSSMDVIKQESKYILNRQLPYIGI